MAGTFWVDFDRAAVARARFGFAERGGRFVVTETGVFFELESALVEGQWWLPYRQRREIQVASPLLGGAVAIRIVTTLSGFEVNTGWDAPELGARLVMDLRDDAFAGAPPAEGEPTDIADFADLVAVVRPPGSTEGVQAALRYERGDHLFRYNRVEGAFLGLAARIQPRDPERARLERVRARGVGLRGGHGARRAGIPLAPGRPHRARARTGAANVGAYRRLRDMTSFRPPLQWELGYALGAALGGYDVRDYYDAAGLEAFGARRRGPLDGAPGRPRGAARLRVAQHGALLLRRGERLSGRGAGGARDARGGGGHAALRPRHGRVRRGRRASSRR